MVLLSFRLKICYIVHWSIIRKNKIKCFVFPVTHWKGMIARVQKKTAREWNNGYERIWWFRTSGCVRRLDNIDYQLRRVSRQRSPSRHRIRVSASKSRIESANYLPLIDISCARHTSDQNLKFVAISRQTIRCGATDKVNITENTARLYYELTVWLLSVWLTQIAHPSCFLFHAFNHSNCLFSFHASPYQRSNIC